LGAMQYLHSKNYTHRDIKPENFLMQDTSPEAEIKVIDFGLAKAYDPAKDADLKTRAGTPYYVAPEVLAGAYDEKCDMWSCGVICYILLCGYPPFYGDNDKEILNMVKRGKFEWTADWDSASADVKDFISSMLTFSRKDRPSASKLLEHKWFQVMRSGKAEGAGMLRLNAGHAANMRKFRAAAKLKKVALTVIAQTVKESEIADLRATFKSMDTNNDGTLTVKEMLDAFAASKDSMGLREEDFKAIISGIDTDGSGKIDYSEFLASTMSAKQYMDESNLWAAFSTFDKDNDGKISKAELAEVLKDNTWVAKMIEEVDLDGDEQISFSEFQAMMKKDAA